ncbi:MAG: hypothetical protein ACOXZW_00370 [Bacilli bacterium]|nr:hypothetical protein [Bacilli bacterium]
MGITITDIKNKYDVIKKEEFQQELFEEIMCAIKNGEDPMKVILDKFETVAKSYDNFDPEIQKMYNSHFAIIKKN